MLPIYNYHLTAMFWTQMTIIDFKCINKTCPIFFVLLISLNNKNII
ncbi:hypothetical protein AB162_206 [Candidatus Palibaumannia cicadellinicola]|uniref:Uncharacterized protein n=1 Tax=Candidatus Palibaumannia cicadellinicola TaxID=186490 RepID=A0A0K2BL75_9GAMM|nr:hypothetical protein AB162_206 [Candidatus Baumannia cicadellinicola]